MPDSWRLILPQCVHPYNPDTDVSSANTTFSCFFDDAVGIAEVEDWAA
jgi:hypothetical protein